MCFVLTTTVDAEPAAVANVEVDEHAVRVLAESFREADPVIVDPKQEAVAQAKRAARKFDVAAERSTRTRSVRLPVRFRQTHY